MCMMLVVTSIGVFSSMWVSPYTDWLPMPGSLVQGVYNCIGVLGILCSRSLRVFIVHRQAERTGCFGGGDMSGSYCYRSQVSHMGEG